MLNTKDLVSGMSSEVRMRNIEAKFKVRDPAALMKRALKAGFRPAAKLEQRDTFFRVANGKLKLREEKGRAMLIQYDRARNQELQRSDYALVLVQDPAGLRSALAASVGILAEVRKSRTLLLMRNIRLHLDRVRGLGTFGEFEAVVGPGYGEVGCKRDVDGLLRKLEINLADLIDVSYMEMLAHKREARRRQLRAQRRS